jgi:hypothetical protein
MYMSILAVVDDGCGGSRKISQDSWRLGRTCQLDPENVNDVVLLVFAKLLRRFLSEDRTRISAGRDIGPRQAQEECWGEMGRSKAALPLTLGSTWWGVEPLGPL